MTVTTSRHPEWCEECTDLEPGEMHERWTRTDAWEVQAGLEGERPFIWPAITREVNDRELTPEQALSLGLALIDSATMLLGRDEPGTYVMKHAQITIE